MTGPRAPGRTCLLRPGVGLSCRRRVRWLDGGGRPFCVADLSVCLLYCRERRVEVCDYSYGFVYFSQLLWHLFCGSVVNFVHI